MWLEKAYTDSCYARATHFLFQYVFLDLVFMAHPILMWVLALAHVLKLCDKEYRKYDFIWDSFSLNHPLLLRSWIVPSFSVKKHCLLGVTVMKVSDTDYRKVMLLTECSLQYWESSQKEAFQYFYLYTRLLTFGKFQIMFPYSSEN